MHCSHRSANNLQMLYEIYVNSEAEKGLTTQTSDSNVKYGRQ